MSAAGWLPGRVMPGKLTWPGIAGGVYGMLGVEIGAGRGTVAAGVGAVTGGGVTAAGGGVTAAGGFTSGTDTVSLGYHLPLEYSHFPSLLVGAPYCPAPGTKLPLGGLGIPNPASSARGSRAGGGGGLLGTAGVKVATGAVLIAGVWPNVGTGFATGVLGIAVPGIGSRPTICLIVRLAAALSPAFN